MKPRYTPQFTQWHNQSHSCMSASSEPWQQHVWVYTTPTYATLHVALITILPTSSYNIPYGGTSE